MLCTTKAPRQCLQSCRNTSADKILEAYYTLRTYKPAGLYVLSVLSFNIKLETRRDSLVLEFVCVPHDSDECHTSLDSGERGLLKYVEDTYPPRRPSIRRYETKLHYE
jgi:hypothetical protein